MSKISEAKFKFLRSHLGIYLGILILVGYGIMALIAYCNSVYIGHSAFVCKIIYMIISILVFSLFGLGLIYPWDKKKSSSSRKRHPRLYRYGRFIYVLFIVAAYLFLSFRTVYPVMADVIQGPQTAVVSYIGMDSEVRKIGRHSGRYTLYHLHFQDTSGRQITINLTDREIDDYREYFESLHHQELVFYPHSHVAVI